MRLTLEETRRENGVLSMTRPPGAWVYFASCVHRLHAFTCGYVANIGKNKKPTRSPLPNKPQSTAPPPVARAGLLWRPLAHGRGSRAHNAQARTARASAVTGAVEERIALVVDVLCMRTCTSRILPVRAPMPSLCSCIVKCSVLHWYLNTGGG